MRPCKSSAIFTALLLVSGAFAQTSTFDEGAEGWTAAQVHPVGHITFQPIPFPVTWDTEFGNPEPSISVDGEFFTTFFMAPADYLGDRTELYGGRLEFDIFYRQLGVSDLNYGAVILVGTENTLYYNAPWGVVDDWTHMSIDLVEGPPPGQGLGWRLNSSTDGSIPTSEEFQGVLGDLRSLYILGGQELVHLDNVNAVPEPATLLALGIAGVAFGAKRRRRKHANLELS